MKELLKKLGCTLAIAISEAALGILLLVSPGGFTAAVITVLGMICAVYGVMSTVKYFRLPSEEGAKTWNLASGAAGICLGAAAIVNRVWLVNVFGVLTMLYGSIVMLSAFLKLQIAVDAQRASHRLWYLMGISFILSAVMATLLFVNPFASEGAAWIFMGITLIITAALDVVYFVLGRRERQENRK